MLKKRIITALVLLPIVLGAVFYLERSLFVWVAGAFFVAGGWEWSAMMPGPGSTARRLGWVAALALVMAATEYYRADFVLTWLPMLWLPALLLVITYPRSASVWYRTPVMAVLGLWLLVPSWAAVVHLQDSGALGLSGPLSLLFVLVWVWAADIGAYFAGRAFGRHKLAPNVSPGKTLEGLGGGVALALGITALVAWGWPVVPGEQPLLLLVAALTVLASALGDLFESMAKRRHGIKDSGTMLPGHGGMLDRIDSVTAALPVAVCALSWAGLPGGL